jgi:Predicted nucleic acid-binding protein, contains PIN domain
MRVLLDTCVISELQHPQGDTGVAATLEAFEEETQFLSVITVGEIAHGIARLNEGQKKVRLTAWLQGLETGYGDRILGIDAETARIWGEITARTRQNGFTLGTPDGLIAATALRHGLHVITRNVADFEPTGVLLINPWEMADAR